MKYILETERLRLREFTLDDTQFVIELFNSPGWLKYIGDRNIRTEDQAKAYLENGPIKSYRDNGYGLSLVETKDNRISIGACGILKRDNLESPDIGFAFLPTSTGKGYAYEIAEATLKYALNTLKLEKIAAITMESNERSIKLLEKIGLRFVKTINFPTSNQPLQFYSMSATDNI